MDHRKILLFLALAFSLSLLGLYLPNLFLEGEGLFRPFLQLILYSWGPAFATLVVQRLIYRQSMAGYGWNRKHFSLRWIAIAAGLPLVLVLGTLGTIVLLGNVAGLPGFGEVILAKVSHADWLGSHVNGQSIWPWFNYPMMPSQLWSLIALILTLGIVGGATFNLMYLTGQEVGFRGFLLRETRSLGFLGSNLVIGGIYGLWQLPLMLFYQPALMSFSGVFWALMATVGFSIAVSFPAAWLTIRSRSIYASATFLGVVSNIAPLTFAFTYGVNPLLGSAQGFVGMLVLLGITFVILRYDRRMVESYDSWVF